MTVKTVLNPQPIIYMFAVKCYKKLTFYLPYIIIISYFKLKVKAIFEKIKKTCYVYVKK